MSQTIEPSADVLEGSESLLLVVDLPGVAKEQLDVRIEGDSLALSAQRGGIRYERSWRLPDVVDQAKIRVALARGVARIELPKQERAKPQRIPVN